jgi:hypothetical protein
MYRSPLLILDTLITMIKTLMIATLAVLANATPRVSRSSRGSRDSILERPDCTTEWLNAGGNSSINLTLSGIECTFLTLNKEQQKKGVLRLRRRLCDRHCRCRRARRSGQTKRGYLCRRPDVDPVWPMYRPGLRYQRLRSGKEFACAQVKRSLKMVPVSATLLVGSSCLLKGLKMLKRKSITTIV